MHLVVILPVPFRDYVEVDHSKVVYLKIARLLRITCLDLDCPVFLYEEVENLSCLFGDFKHIVGPILADVYGPEGLVLDYVLGGYAHLLLD